MSLKSSLIQVLILSFIAAPAFSDEIPEIRIIASAEEMISIYQEADYWGELEPDKILQVPPILAVATVKEWRQEAAAMTVQDKKELFYRSLLPLVLYANEVITVERERLKAIVLNGANRGNPGTEDAAWLLDLAVRYRVIKVEDENEPVLPGRDELGELMNELLLRVDTIPASLALGQGAYESGYGTSRFALEGNSFFGQWTYGGKGMQPREKRAAKGNYGVAAYTWPLDSVRSYMMNLNTHRAYSELRQRRADLRERGEKVTGAELAKSLDHYSERGEAYVKTLTGMMRVNELDAADDAQLMQQALVLIVNSADEKDAEVVAREISDLRASGELARLVSSMGIVDF
jgi:uncharacterized FlgJ-related protein